MAKKIQRETIFQIGAIVLTVAAFGAAVFAVSKMITAKNPNPDGSNPYETGSKVRTTLTYNGKDYALKDDMEVIMVIGVDDYEVMGENGKNINQSQADVIYVYAIDHASKTYKALQINRETVTGVKTYSNAGADTGIEQMQICLAHTYGMNDNERCRNMMDAVSGLIYDIPIDHYISLTMAAIPVFNDQVGGVTVTIPEDMTVVDPSFREGATITLHGDQAERFVRSRMSLANDTNSFRMLRQQIFLDSWMAKAAQLMESDTSFSFDLIMALSDYMVSDMTANQLSDFSSRQAEYQDLGTVTPEGELIDDDNNAFREFHVDYDDLEAKVIDMFYDEVSP